MSSDRVAVAGKTESVTGKESSVGDKDLDEYHERGRAIYNFRCYFCHGYSGDAKTLATSFLNPKPRDFTSTDPATLTRQAMIKAVTHGRDNTAMKSFSATIGTDEIAAVVDFVRQEFMLSKSPNTHYHTVENGWPDHQRYAAAFPFALGEIALDSETSSLTTEQQAGKRLFMSSCVICHDRGKVNDEGVIWDVRAVSFPRNQVTPEKLAKQMSQPQTADSVSTATPYAKHDIKPVIDGLKDAERKGEVLFQSNCAFCHAADGTGKNWIGSFLEPHPRNLISADFMKSMTRKRLRKVINEGLPGTSMSAWKDVLGKAQIESIIAYIDRAFHPVPE